MNGGNTCPTGETNGVGGSSGNKARITPRNKDKTQSLVQKEYKCK